MIKGKTALTVFKEFVEREERIPTLDEFRQIGYTKTTYYKAKKDYLAECLEKEQELIGRGFNVR